MNSITKRWLRSSLLITFLLVAGAVSIYIYTLISSSYNGVQQAMFSRISSMGGQLKITTGQTAEQTAQNRGRLLRRMVEQFDEKDKFEFMLLDSEGQVIATSSGGTLGYKEIPEDFFLAMESPNSTGRSVYTSVTGERVMALTVMVPYPAEDVAALRMGTSLTMVDQMMVERVLLALGIGAAILLFSVWSGVFFIRSIVRPLDEVAQTANAIARGDLSARLPEGSDSDEIGRLCNTINQMAGELSKTERLQNEFISSVSHELRTPLTSIRGWVETIAHIRDPEDENYRKGLSIIGRETDRLYDMVEELLSFSRLQSGVKLDCCPLDLVAELTDAALFMEARIRAEGLHLVYEEPELPLPIWADAGRLRQVFINVMDNAVKYSLPGGAITLDEGLHLVYEEPELPLPIWADAGRLRQVFINVMDNAVKYSLPGGAITLDLLQDGENVYVLIQDEGRGIAPDDLENVKLKFFKGKGAVRGSGIGLAVVDEIMTALDGSADISSELGKGTTVTLRLPIYRGGGEPPAWAVQQAR